MSQNPIPTPRPDRDADGAGAPRSGGPRRVFPSFDGYEVIEEIARGAMGIVYRARQKSLDRIVALKTIIAGQFAEELEVRRFVEEARAAAGLQHPNIVAIHEIGTQGGNHFFTMDFVEGKTLAAEAGRKPVEPRRAAKWLETVARAIHHAHEQGVLHRDLKPGNILIDRAGEPRVTDFGLAKRVQSSASLTIPGGLVGTPSYMPPEQTGLTGGTVGPWSDVYALGAVLYELLTGRPPFVAAGAVETVLQAIETEPAAPRSLNRDVPRDLETICLKCLSKEPARRYGSARDLADDLARYLAGQHILARPIGPAGRMTRWCRRNPAVASLTAAVFLALAIGVAVSANLAFHLRTQRNKAFEARDRAERAEKDRTASLWDASLARARAARRGGAVGRRFETLEAVAAAAAIRPSRELRDEAIAALSLCDLQPEVQWIVPEDLGFLTMDHDLERYAAMDATCGIRILDSRTNAEVARLPAVKDRPWVARFSPDGKYLWSKHHPSNALGQARILVREIATGRVVVETPGAFSADFSPDGASVAVAGIGGRVAVHSLATGAEQWSFPDGAGDVGGGVAWHPSGSRIAVASLGRLGVEIREAGGNVRHLPAPGAMRDVAWSGDGRLLAGACGDSKTHVWDTSVDPPAEIFSVQHEQAVLDVAFAHRAPLLACLSWDGMLRLVDIETGLTISSIAGGAVPLAFRADDKALFGTADPGTGFLGTLTVGLPAATRVLRPDPQPTGGSLVASSLAFDPAGAFVAATYEDGLRIWDRASGRQIFAWLAGKVACVAWSAEEGGFLLNSADRLFRLAREGGRFPAEPSPVFDDYGVFFTPVPGTRHVAIARKGGAVLRDMAASGLTAARLGGQEWGGYYVAASPDGRLVATANSEGTGIRVFEARSGALVTDLPAEGLGASAEFSPDGSHLLVCSSREYAVWAVDGWKKGRRLTRSRTGIRACSFSADGRLAALSVSAGAISLHDFPSLEPLCTLLGPEDRAGVPEFDAEGTTVGFPVSGGGIRLYYLPELRRVLRPLLLDWSTEPIPDAGEVRGLLEDPAPVPATASPPAPPPDFAGTIVTKKLSPARGTRRVLAILWDPHRKEHPAPPREDIERILFGEGPSVADWFRENSGGALAVEKAGCLGWYDAAKPGDHYWAAQDPADADGDGWTSGHVEKWAEAIRRADAEFDFAAFDDNRDGSLDPTELAVLVVIPQNNPFGTVRPLCGRQAPAVEPLEVDGVRIPEVAEWYAGTPANLGAPAHELSHLLLDLPDLYTSPANRFAPGSFCLMDASYACVHLNPFLKLKLGWVSADVAPPSGEHDLEAVERGRRVIVLFDPARGAAEYFLVENRWREGSLDAGAGDAGRGLPADGIAVWHIVEDPAVFARLDPSAGGPEEWGRRGIRLVRADGGLPRDDGAALLSRPGDRLAGDSRPAALTWSDGTPAPFEVVLRSPPGPSVRLSIRLR